MENLRSNSTTQTTNSNNSRGYYNNNTNNFNNRGGNNNNNISNNKFNNNRNNANNTLNNNTNNKSRFNNTSNLLSNTSTSLQHTQFSPTKYQTANNFSFENTNDFNQASQSINSYTNGSIPFNQSRNNYNNTNNSRTNNLGNNLNLNSINTGSVGNTTTGGSKKNKANKRKGNAQNNNNKNKNNNINTLNKTPEQQYRNPHPNSSERLNRSLNKDYTSPNSSFSEPLNQFPTSVSLEHIYLQTDQSSKKMMQQDQQITTSTASSITVEISSFNNPQLGQQSESTSELSHASDDINSFYSTPLSNIVEQHVQHNRNYLTHKTPLKSNGDTSEDMLSEIDNASPLHSLSSVDDGRLVNASTNESNQLVSSASTSSSPVYQSPEYSNNVTTDSQMLVTASEGEYSFKTEEASNTENTIMMNPNEVSVSNDLNDLKTTTNAKNDAYVNDETTTSDSNKSIDGSMLQSNSEYDNKVADSDVCATSNTIDNVLNSFNELLNIEESKFQMDALNQPDDVASEDFSSIQTVQNSNNNNNNSNKESVSMIGTTSLNNSELYSSQNNLNTTGQEATKTTEIVTTIGANVDEASLKYSNIEEEEVTDLVSKIVLDVVSQVVQVAPLNQTVEELNNLSEIVNTKDEASNESTATIAQNNETVVFVKNETISNDEPLKIIEIISNENNKLSSSSNSLKQEETPAPTPVANTLVPEVETKNKETEVDSKLPQSTSTNATAGSSNSTSKKGKSAQKKEPVVDCFSCTII